METNLDNVGKLLAVVSTIKTPSFVRIINYSNDKGNGEIADYTINLGASYGNAKENDIEFLKNADNIKNIEFGKLLEPFAETARAEMLESRLNPKNPRSIAQIEAYINICPNIKVHKESGRVFVYGFLIRKDVTTEGNYKSVNSRPLTLAKKKIEKELKCPKFRELAFDKLQSVTLKGETIEITIG